MQFFRVGRAGTQVWKFYEIASSCWPIFVRKRKWGEKLNQTFNLRTLGFDDLGSKMKAFNRVKEEERRSQWKILEFLSKKSFSGKKFRLKKFSAFISLDYWNECKVLWSEKFAHVFMGFLTHAISCYRYRLDTVKGIIPLQCLTP